MAVGTIHALRMYSAIDRGMAEFFRWVRMRRVYMQYKRENGWRVTFLDAKSLQPIGKTFRFHDPIALVLMAERGGAVRNLEDKHAMEEGFRTGIGGVYLNLAPDQLGRLLRA